MSVKLVSSPAKRRCVAALAPPFSALDRGVDDITPADDPLKLKAMQIIDERRTALYGTTLPDRLEVRFLPPHMMRFPQKAFFSSAQEPLRWRDGLPERDTRFDTWIKAGLRLFRRRKPSLESRVNRVEDGPRLNNLSLRQSYRYPTAYPEGCEGEGEPSLGMTILLSRGLQSDYALRSAIERELCIVAETNCIGAHLAGPVFRLLARRTMLKDPSILVTAHETDPGSEPRLQCLNLRCGASQPVNDDGARCHKCGAKTVTLPNGSNSLPDIVRARFGGPLARIGTPLGFVLLQVLRVVVWPATPIWSSATTGDIAIRSVFFLGFLGIGVIMVFYWLTPKGGDTFLGNLGRIRSPADRLSQVTAQANTQEEIRQLRIKEGKQK